MSNLSSTTVRKVSAGNSVAVAMVKVRKMSSPREPTFRTCPSKTRDIAIQMTINNKAFFRNLGVLKMSRTEYDLWASESLIACWVASYKMYNTSSHLSRINNDNLITNLFARSNSYVTNIKYLLSDNRWRCKD